MSFKQTRNLFADLVENNLLEKRLNSSVKVYELKYWNAETADLNNYRVIPEDLFCSLRVNI